MLLLLYIKAFRGYLLWKRLEKRYGADHYILMPECDEEYNYYALLHLEDFIASKGAEKSYVLLSRDNGVQKALGLFNGSDKVKLHRISGTQTDNLIQYYALYEFSPKLTIVSLTRPYDTGAQNLLGINGVTKEELLCYDIYRLKGGEDRDAPDYKGTDEDIIRFLALGRHE
ncbi:MAG: hypothetical protein K6E34_14085 [Lachnospiraceae bacterium]|nr:hypothetical protein [Lachnospiraceae bacterium]